MAMNNIDTKTIVIVFTAVLLLVILVLIAFNRRKLISKSEKKIVEILEPGWQFYAKPTTLDAPGTVFRIDKEGRKYTVENLKIVTIKGKEVSGRSTKSGNATIGVIANLLGIEDLGISGKGKKVEKLEFEISDPEKEETTDIAIDEVLDPFLQRLDYRIDNRYFIIREARLASAMKYYLSEQLVNNICGDASRIVNSKVKGEFKRTGKGVFEINQKFNEPMRIMFLPEEITQITAGLAVGKPQLGLAPVTDTLLWEEE